MIFVSNWFATAAGPRLRWFVLRTIVLQNRGVCSSLYSQGCSPDYCASGKAKRLKQLMPGLIARSRAECEHRVLALMSAARASLFERLLNDLFAGRFDQSPPSPGSRRSPSRPTEQYTPDHPPGSDRSRSRCVCQSRRGTGRSPTPAPTGCPAGSRTQPRGCCPASGNRCSGAVSLESRIFSTRQSSGTSGVSTRAKGYSH